MFSDAPKLWPLTKGSEKTTWMHTNSEKFYHEIHLAIDSVEKAMILPANCPRLWDDKVLRADLATFVPQALSPPSTTAIRDNVQPVQQVLERSNRLAKPDTKTAAALQDSMSSIFALSMVGQPYDLTKMCEQDPGTGDLKFTEEFVAATKHKGFGVAQSPAGVGMSIAYTSVHTNGSAAVILANYTGRYLLSNEDRSADEKDKRIKCGDILHFSHMMYACTGSTNRWPRLCKSKAGLCRIAAAI